MIMCHSRRCVSAILLTGVVLLVLTFLVTCDELTTTDDYLAPGYPLVGCSGNPADVVFVLDTSNSIWSRDFRDQLYFVRDVITLFPIDSGIIRVGLVTYADFPTLHFRLDQYDRKSDVQSAISRIRHVGGYGTRTAEALRFLRNVAFQFPVSANRINVTRVGIVVTDGLSDDPEKTRREAERTRERGIHLFAVGVGSSRDLEELEAIASYPKGDYTILADSYRGLNNIRKLLAIKTCAVTNPTTTTTTTTTPTSTTSITTTSTTTEIPRKTMPPHTRSVSLTSILKTLVPTIDGYPPSIARSTDQISPMANSTRFAADLIWDQLSTTTADNRATKRNGFTRPTVRIEESGIPVETLEYLPGSDGKESTFHELRVGAETASAHQDGNRTNERRAEVAEEDGRFENDLEKANLPGKRPVFWKLETNGFSSRIWQEKVKFGDDEVLPFVANGSKVIVEADEIWITEDHSGHRSLVGKVINGSKFIGHWIDADRRIWFGYALLDTAERGNGINASRNSVDAIPEIGNSRQGREEGTSSPDEGESPGEDVTDGFWVTDEAGRSVWYRYVRQGVYESARESEMSEKFRNTTVAIDDATTNDSGNRSPSSNIREVTRVLQLQNGCRPRKPTDLAFVLDHKSRHPELIRDSWVLARAIISELDTEEEDRLSFQFVHECSDSACLEPGPYSSKADALRAVDATLQAIEKNSTHLIDKMRDSLADNEIRRRRKVGFYMTNSRSGDFDATVLASDRAKNVDDIEMFAVGFGGSANPTELQAVASCPVKQHYYLLERRLTDQTAKAVARKISRLVCAGRNKA